MGGLVTGLLCVVFGLQVGEWAVLWVMKNLCGMELPPQHNQSLEKDKRKP